MDKIAVVTPCFNGEKFVAQCVETVEKSVTLDKFVIEHILIDDNSTDDTREVLSGLTSKKIKCIFRTTNGGATVARNEGMAVTDAKYIFFLDQDDLLFANSLRYLYETAEEANGAWVYGDFLRSDADGRYLVGQDYFGWRFENTTAVLAAMYSGRHFFQQNSLFVKSTVEKVGGFRLGAGVVDDFDLCTRILLGNTYPIYVPGPLYLHRFHENNQSIKATADPNEHRMNVKNLFGEYKDSLEKILDTNQMKRIYEFLG